MQHGLPHNFLVSNMRSTRGIYGSSKTAFELRLISTTFLTNLTRCCSINVFAQVKIQL